jgi:hypothetical protein
MRYPLLCYAFRQAYIPGAVNIAPEKIKELAPRLLPVKDAENPFYGPECGGPMAFLMRAETVCLRESTLQFTKPEHAHFTPAAGTDWLTFPTQSLDISGPVRGGGV